MDFDDTPAEAAFRTEARAWLDRHATAKGSTEDFASGFLEGTLDHASHQALSRAWQRTLFDHGWAGITWPKAFGGRGGTAMQAAIFNQEMGRYGVSTGAFAVGIGMAGPTILKHGSDEQRARYLPAMLRGDEIWCQLFSEPEAGSDLAAIRTRARRDGDEWVVNGQKVWTSSADHSDWGILLARTDPDVPKHKGLTMFIVPMDASGVTVRGLRQISGEAEFNEVFFDDVALEADSVVGGVGNGWGTALTVLMFERLTIGFGSESYGSSAQLAATLGSDASARADSEVRHRLGEIITEMLAVRFNGYRALTALAKGQIPGPEAGLAKVTLVNAAIGASELATDVLGPDALQADTEWSYITSFLPGLKSAGGTEQILRNTIGERVLGLPAEPRLDKGMPFSELRAKERQAAAS